MKSTWHGSQICWQLTVRKQEKPRSPCGSCFSQGCAVCMCCRASSDPPHGWLVGIPASFCNYVSTPTEIFQQHALKALISVMYWSHFNNTHTCKTLCLCNSYRLMLFMKFECKAKTLSQSFFSISDNIDIYYNIHLPLMGKEMLFTWLLDLKKECKRNYNINVNNL